MAIRTVTDAIRYVGADDNTLTLFENQYPVQPMGVSYNSYVILDEKIAVMDSVDARAAEEWSFHPASMWSILTRASSKSFSFVNDMIWLLCSYKHFFEHGFLEIF